MKKLLIGVATSGLVCAAISSATAQSMLEACEAKAVEEGYDPAGCSCLVDAAKEDSDLAAEFASLGELATLEDRRDAASAEAREVIDKCFPE